MQLLISRHGNTFGPGDKVVTAGLTNDLPLVEKGGEQAENLAKALIEQNIKPTVVVCSKLVRCKRYAEIVMEKVGIPGEPIIDERLNELDYGGWTGKSDEEIVMQYGSEGHDGWQQRSEWPTNAHWGSDAQTVINEVQSFAKDAAKFANSPDDVVLVITSNGRLRYFLTLVDGAFEESVKERTFKVKTGYVSKLTAKNGKFSVDFWNQDPAKVQL